ncbi:MAG TPA: hypothetical protein VM165_22885 [Planctomycetaceae bacterium]|nr:hypothetical protein [Planctomycetaceae bacterium]
MHGRFGFLLLIIAAFCGVRVLPVQAQTASTLTLLQKNHAELRAEYVGQLQRIAAFCGEHGFPDGTAEIERLLAPADGQRIRASSLPKNVEPELPAELPAEERQWRTQLRYQRKEYAKKLYLLSRRALHAGFPAYAYELVRELAVQDPDHAKARELLGYVLYKDEWVTPYAKKMLLKGADWDDRFGWLPKGHLARYENDERFVDGRWMSVAKEATIRQDFAHAWEINTDHYRIRTNYSLERGVELGRALEEFYEFFHQTFAGFFNDPEQLKRLFDGTAPGVVTGKKQYLVNYYRTREEYVERLERAFPQIRVTNGIYLTGDRTAHFYHDETNDHEATLFHEGTHQLFFESNPQNRQIGEAAHFWIIEGIACYMESFRRENGEFSVGDPKYIRFAGARMNALDQNYYMPFPEFDGMGMREFQNAPMLVKNYTQAAGLAHFFMQYDSGRYRDALVTHLVQLYSANARKREAPQTLDQLTGTSARDLDREYHDWLRQCRETLGETATTPAQ